MDGTSTLVPTRLALWAAGAPLVFALVVASHVSLRSSADLSPWKGGGFGMFSTIDSPGTRLLRIELRSDLGTTPVAVPPSLEQLANETRAAPSPGRLDELASALAGELWVVPRMPTGTSSDPGASPEQAALDQMASDVLADVLPVDTVRAVTPDALDLASQRPIDLTGVSVEVLRLEATASDGGGPAPDAATAEPGATGGGAGNAADEPVGGDAADHAQVLRTSVIRRTDLAVEARP